MYKHYQTANANQDLVWKLSGFSYPEKAVAFLKRFEGSFCIFSKSVRQLYSNYELQQTFGEGNSVVALPNPHAYHDTFFNIPEEAILPTGMVICPGEVSGSENWLLCYKNGEGNGWKGTSLAKGIDLFREKYGKDDPFLPVLLNSDLKKSSSTHLPLMHLHRISIKKLNLLSELQRKDIAATVADKFSKFAA